MNEYSNDDIENKISREQKEILSSGQEMGNLVPSGTNEMEKEVLEDSPEKKPIKNILFVDDEKPICKLFQETLRKSGYNVRVAPNGNEGMKVLRESPVDLVITDIFMPEKDGHEFIMDIIQELPEVKIFAITGHKSYDSEMELDIAQTLGAGKVFTKPCKLSELLGAIKEL